MEQKELALQWARAKFYHDELAAQGSTKPAVGLLWTPCVQWFAACEGSTCEPCQFGLRLCCRSVQGAVQTWGGRDQRTRMCHSTC